jgi:NAD+ kinase
MKPKFKTIGLWGEFSNANVAAPAAELVTHLRACKLDALCLDQEGIPPTLTDVPRLSGAELAAKVDLVVAIGGDGTLLRAARSAATEKIPLLGVNLGRLGFLTDVTPEQMLDIIDAVLSGDFIEENRVMLEARLDGPEHSGQTMLALNDVAAKVGRTGHMLDFATYVNGDYVNTHGGDGIIVATTTGSTAYALSCGGPIIQPTVDALVLVPICPHTLSDRPLVIPSSSHIEVRVEPRFDDRAQVSCDGETFGGLSENDKLSIRVADATVRLLHPHGYDYFELLRSKLSWGHSERANGRN